MAFSVWNHDGDVIGSLRRNELVEKFKVSFECVICKYQMVFVGSIASEVC